jgi:methionyl-tRNA formyltransferase
MGSDSFSLPILRSLMEQYSDVFRMEAILTAAPKPQGRGHKIIQTAVHQYAQKLGIPVFTPSKLHKQDWVDAIQGAEIDLIIVASYGLILPQWFLDLPKYGCINVHPSLLPAWRGACPIPFALWNGDSQTGVSIMLMDAGMDTGPVLIQKTFEIDQKHNTESLTLMLSEESVTLLVKACQEYSMGDLKPSHQSGQGISYARKLEKSEGLLDFQQSAFFLERQVRAFHPWPGTWFLLNGKRIQVCKAKVLQILDPFLDLSIGQIYRLPEGGFGVMCADGFLLIPLILKPEGKNWMTDQQFLNGFQGALQRVD